jgi:hypothetical protein
MGTYSRSTDGGVTAPPEDGIIRKSALLRAELHSVGETSQARWTQAWRWIAD